MAFFEVQAGLLSPFSSCLATLIVAFSSQCEESRPQNLCFQHPSVWPSSEKHTSWAFCFISLGYMNPGCAAARRSWGRHRWGVQMVYHQLKFSAPAHAQLPTTSAAAPADPPLSITVQGLQIATISAPSSSAETHQPQTRGSWQCLKFIIFSHGKKLTCKPIYRAWVCCCCFTWMLNWAFNWFPQPIFQV